MAERTINELAMQAAVQAADHLEGQLIELRGQIDQCTRDQTLHVNESNKWKQKAEDLAAELERQKAHHVQEMQQLEERHRLQSETRSRELDTKAAVRQEEFEQKIKDLQSQHQQQVKELNVRLQQQHDQCGVRLEDAKIAHSKELQNHQRTSEERRRKHEYSLSNRITNYERQIVSLKQVNLEQSTRSKERIDQLQGELRVARNEIESINREFGSMTKKMKLEHDSELRSTRNNSSRVLTIEAQIKAVKEEWARRLEQVTREYEKKSQEAALTCQRNIDDMQRQRDSEIQTRDREIQAIHQKLLDTTAELEQIRTNIGKDETDLVEVREERDNLKSRLGELSNTHDETSRILTEAKLGLEELKEREEQLKVALRDSETARDGALTRNKSMEMTIRGLRDNIQQCSSERESKEQQVAQLESTHRELVETQRLLQDELSLNRGKYATEIKQLHEEMRQRDETWSKRDEAMRQSLKNAILAANEQKAKLQQIMSNQRDQMNAEREAVVQQFSTCTRDQENLQRALSKLRDEQDTMSKSFIERLDRSENQSHELRKRFQELDGEYQAHLKQAEQDADAKLQLLQRRLTDSETASRIMLMHFKAIHALNTMRQQTHRDAVKLIESERNGVEDLLLALQAEHDGIKSILSRIPSKCKPAQTAEGVLQKNNMNCAAIRSYQQELETELQILQNSIKRLQHQQKTYIQTRDAHRDVVLKLEDRVVKLRGLVESGNVRGYVSNV